MTSEAGGRGTPASGSPRGLPKARGAARVQGAVGAGRLRAGAKLRAAMETGDPREIEACTETLLAPGVIWLGPAGGACHSRDEVLGVLRTQLDEGVTLQVLSLEPVGDQMLLCVNLRPPVGVRRPELPWRVVLTLDEDGRIVHMQDYADADIARSDMDLRARGPKRAKAAAKAPGAVSGLVPFAHVSDLEASAAFYQLLGFAVESSYRPKGPPVWMSLAAGDARLMLALSGEPVRADEQAVLFYLYSPDLAALRDRLIAHGVLAGEIVDGSPGPLAEMRVEDPDGYTLMIAQLGT